jgi:hypothetical protein
VSNQYLRAVNLVRHCTALSAQWVNEENYFKRILLANLLLNDGRGKINTTKRR